ncbi:hypothetical protein DSO57_1002831 [Entomophthora muscae]|uniref:Uncharacterized protein n=1 Tax=Entomophthora muscae TaxID=34485 RepID=A0ACC2RZW0_9FUNG|nr:hypothetical protein DSO57_1002831 [Entomophthora muscae]
MASFSSMGQFFDDVTRLVDDLVAVECQVHAEYCSSRTELAQGSTTKPSLSSIISESNQKLSIPRTSSFPPPIPTFKSSFIPKQIPLNPRAAKVKAKAARRLSKPDKPSKRISAPIHPISLPTLARASTHPVESRFINPFVKEASDTNNGEGKQIPLTMFSLFQIPLENNMSDIPPQLISEDGSEISDADTDSSCDDDSLSTSPPPPPPFMVYHPAAFRLSDPSLSSLQLSSEFRLLYARDRIIASSDPERAYFIKYANELVASRAAMNKAKADNSRRLFKPSDFTHVVRDLHGICPAISPSEMLIQEKRQAELLRFDGYNKGRDIRPNSDGWRILAAEFSMIHANKIVRPLKPRAYLPKRRAEFSRDSSPLRKARLY